MTTSVETIKGLREQVDLWRDEWGIPHMRAKSSADAFFALGYVHATDRLWQMDAMRRRVMGRYAEHVGPVAVPMDILVRRLGITECCKRDLAALKPETREMLSAYAAGVNAFIATGNYPIEYQLLGEAPEPWEDWHAIAVQRQTGLVIITAYTKLWRAIALPVLGPDAIGKLRMDGGGDELVCMPPGEVVRRLDLELAELGASIAALLAKSPQDATGGGSNNWALSGSRTASGRPLVAGDPHRHIDMPNIYLQAHVACDEFDVVGIMSPGVPGFPHFGHNENVAWGVTIAFVDTVDIYLERFRDGGASYLFRANEDGSGEQWQAAERRTETVKVRGGADVACEIVRTARGPVVAGDPAKGKALVLRHASDVEADHALDCMIPMMKAKNVEELYEAVRGWGLVDHNLVSGDTSGHIGHRVRARVPKRPASNGWLPVPGWLEKHAWQGWIPHEEMPVQIDPEGGIIVTANNRVTMNSPHYLTTDCHPPHRARRILDRLLAMPKATVEDMQAVHRDSVSIPALEMCARLKALKLDGPRLAQLRDRLTAWDGQILAASEEADLYTTLRLAVVDIVARLSGLSAMPSFDDRMIAPGIGISTQLNWCVPDLLRENDTSFLGGKSWEDVLTEALGVASKAPRRVWGERHRLRLHHPLAGQFPNEDVLKSRDMGPLDGDHETVFATGYIPHLGVDTTYASVLRYVFDVGNWDACRWVVFHGVSGDPRSPHYDDQSETWRKGETIPMQYDWAKIAATAASHITLKPLK